MKPSSCCTSRATSQLQSWCRSKSVVSLADPPQTSQANPALSPAASSRPPSSSVEHSSSSLSGSGGGTTGCVGAHVGNPPGNHPTDPPGALGVGHTTSLPGCVRRWVSPHSESCHRGSVPHRLVRPDCPESLAQFVPGVLTTYPVTQLLPGPPDQG